MKVRKEAHEAAAFTKFRLLMWKNFLQQWRHRIQTVVELLLPVMTMTLALILRWQIEPTPRDTLVYPSIPAHTLNYSTMVLAGMNITRMSIAYSPRSPELDDVLRSAVTNLLERNAMDLIPILEEYLPPELEIPPEININSTEIYEFVKSLISVNAYNNSSELRGIYALEETTRLVLAAVEFDDQLYGSTELPTNISYSLRFPERPRLYSFYSRGGRSWRTDYVFPSFETPGPRFPSSWEGGNNPGYVNEMFIALQHAISMELISRITGEDMKNFIVNIQRYPHPPFVQDVALEAFQILIPLFIVLSFSYTAVNIVRSVTLEKELQLKETMKIMGLPTWLHWIAWFCKQFIYLLVTSILIIIILKINWFTTEDGFSDYSVFTNTPWTVLLFFFVIYLTCIIFFCFMISSFFSKGSTAALFTGIAWFLSAAPAALITMEGEVSVGLQVFTCLGINTAMTFGVQLLYGRESTGGIQWGDFMSSPSTESSRLVFGHVVLMLVVDCVLYMLITLYFEQVLPGPFGTPKRWYFPFQKEFWFPSRENYADRVIFENDSTDDILKENDPTGHAIGVKMNNLTKIYGSNIVVNNLSLNIYDDQITVLLGHNGAGKSTTISMLTGNLEVSHGSVTVAGYDIGRQAGAARSHLGLCPQHNVLFNELTVREHLEFYARLKGYSGKELHEEIDSLIEKLELKEKRDSESQELSGGQKRRLSVGIALCGAARVVLLDEPTSGMDPASRRALWDLLQREKKGRSMILTTHFMDEADILGDRIAILANGRLQCVGSPHFLKQNHGVGYSLVVVKEEGFDFDACSDLIDKYIPGAVKDDRGSEVRYVLTNDFSHIFEPMLCDLDNNIDAIKFKNYGLISTTLEDVFMSLGSDMALVDGVSVSDDGATTLDSASDDVLRQEFDSLEQLNKDEEKVTGVRLLCQHVLAVWLKLWLVWSRSWGLVLMQLTVPVVLINLTLAVFSFVMSFVDGIQARNLTLTEGFARTETLLSYSGTSTTAFGSLAKAAYELIFDTNGIDTMTLTMVNNEPIVDHYLERAQDPVTLGIMRHSVLIGATFDEDSATAWFSNFGYHDVAVSLSAVHSALLKALNSTAQLNVYNYPLEVQYTQQNDMQTMVTLLSMQLSNGIGTSVAIVSAVFIMFYIKERVSGAKLLQQAAGLQPVLLWTSAAVFDWLWFITISLTVLASCFAFNVLGLSTPDELGRLYLCLIVYGAAMIPMNYLFSHFFRGPALGFVVMFFINVIFGMMGAQIVEALSAPQLDTAEAATVLDYILQCFPMYSFVTAVRLLNQIELTVLSCLQVCDYMTSIRPNITECTMDALCENDIVACCVRDNPHFDWEAPGILRYLLVMVIVCAVLWVVLLFVEYRLFHKIYKLKKTLPPVDMSSLDEDVADEARHVQRVPPARLAEHGLVAKDLAKYYGKHLAVDQISFTVNDSECFGLLGVNGAGKTTTFKMLMGDESISSGEAFVSGHSVQKDITRVHNNIGYCPQFDALFNELTGRETLRVFSLLRGLRSDTAAVQAEALAHSLGFHKHFDKRVEQYSGGTKRKLNTAVSFLGRARMVFVDEPTTGVDPAAKRHVWRAIRGVQRAGRGVVLTSHSMEECEALCSRLTIMVNGRFQCIGTPQHLKNKFSQGFTLTIKIRAKDVSRRSSGASDLEAIKNYINSNFSNPKIMEEYQGVLTYYLPDRTMPWSRMFGVMERAKRDLQVEYYNISQTTLEQIFLQFTKYQRENLNIS